MADSRQIDRRPLRLAYWGQLIALLTTALVLAYLSWASYREAIGKAETTSGSIARVNALALDTTLGTADMLLAETAATVAPRMGNRAALDAAWRDEARRLRLYLLRIPQLNSIRVFDANGDQLLTTDREGAERRVNVADRPHFQQARDSADAGLIISDVVVSRTTNRNAVVLLRAIRDGDGRFLGAVSAPLDLAYFERLLADAQLGVEGTAAVRRIDSGKIVASHPYLPGIINKIDPAHPAHRKIEAGAVSGTVTDTGQFDGVERILGFRRLEHFPLYVVVGISRAGVLETWQWRALAAGVLVALALLSVSLFYRRLASANQLLGGVLDAASEVAIVATDHRGRITLFNHGAENLLGYGADEVVGQLRLDQLQLAPATDTPRAQQAWMGRTEQVCRRKNGSPVEISRIVTPLDAGDPGHSGYLCVAHDITDNRRAAGLRTAQNRVLEMIASDTPLPRVLDELVRGIEAQADGLLGAVMLFDALAGTLRMGAAPSLPDAYRHTVDGLVIGPHRDAGAAAGFLHDAVLIDDLQTDPRWSPLHAAALAAGLRTVWSTPIHDAGGRLLGIFALHRGEPPIDVTAAARLVDVATHTAAIGIASALSATALAAGEKRMRLALHAANMEAYEYVPATDRVHRSGDLSHAWGLGTEGSGNDYFTRIHPDDRAALCNALGGLRPDSPDYAVEYRLQLPDERHIWLADWASAVFDDDGRIDRIFGVCRDISGRRAMEDELHRYQQHLEQLVAERTAQLSSSEANLRLILESAADGLYGVDNRGRLTFINPAACRMLGLDPDALVGRHIHPLIHHSHPDGRTYPVCDCPTNQTLSHGQVMTVTDEVYWHSDGHPVPVIYSTHPMIRDGQIVGAVVSFMDVTERRALEEAREQARLAAERLARVKSEFLANMSHEIRTPLNGILGFARIGHRDSADPHLRSVFGHILDSGQLLLGVVNDILDFSKIEAGKLHMEAVPVDLPRLLERSLSAFDERARSRGLALRLQLDPSLPASCRTDPLRLGQILTNLLSNGLKFTEAGEVSLHAALDGETLVFRVGDTGIGIDAAQLGQLFSPFEQADSSTTRRFGGTGLGLAITKRIVDLLGGSISATSTVGRGSTFEVRLPNTPAARPAMPDQPSAAAQPERLARIRVLAAEDNEVNQMVLEDMLLSEGATLTLVDNGRAAVDAVRSHGADAFDVVLMDIQMPEMDGYTATRQICALAPGLPVIGQTAHALAEERAKCLDAGMVAHIAKPLDLDSLVGLIQSHVRAPAQPAPVAPAPTIDRDALAARYPGRPEFIARLLGIFAGSAADRQAALDAAIAAGDLPRIVEVAHALKGSAGNIMAARLAGLARETEAAARDGRPEALGLAADLRAAIADAVAEIAPPPA
ncbi:PAS domain S-box protein [Zoogloea sp.]|uniref:PAS domain S-box protein n=1 Tax=Zoogloea sp. TaxID=49181 RepID=UPI0035B2D705